MAYKILSIAWSLESALFLASLLLLSSGERIGWIFLFFTFIGYVTLLIVSAVTFYASYSSKKRGLRETM